MSLFLQFALFAFLFFFCFWWFHRGHFLRYLYIQYRSHRISILEMLLAWSLFVKFKKGRNEISFDLTFNNCDADASDCHYLEKSLVSSIPWYQVWVRASCDLKKTSSKTSVPNVFFEHSNFTNFSILFDTLQNIGSQCVSRTQPLCNLFDFILQCIYLLSKCRLPLCDEQSYRIMCKVT